MPNVPRVPGVPALASYAVTALTLLTGDDFSNIDFTPPPWGIYYQGTPVIQPASIGNNPNAAIGPFSIIAGALGLPNLNPVAASTIEFDFDQEWTIADTPQEQGAFQSYDKVQLPFDVRIRLAAGGDASNRQTFINAILAIAGGSPLGTSSLATSDLSSASSMAGLSSIASSLNGGILSGMNQPPLFDIVTPEGTFSGVSCKRLSFSRRADEGATLIRADLYFLQIRETSTASFSNTAIPGAAGQQSSGNQQPSDAYYAGFSPAALQ
jgi:hypothetical protein